MRTARFDAFELDFVTRRLRRDGNDIHLAPKAFELLALLTEAAPRVVSKRELHARLWPNGAVTDATLVGLVKQLRRALANRDRRCRLIRTVHRVGYAFEGAIAREEVIASSPRVARWLVAEQRRLPLVDGENIVGRDPQSDVHLDHATVSRRHARIIVADSQVLIEDLDSKNGTRIDGVPTSGSATLRAGNRIGFGTLLLTYRESSAGMPTLTQVTRVERGRSTL